MIQITKQEAMALLKKGIGFTEGGISRTYSKHHHYFLCETAKNLRELKKIREEKVLYERV